MNKRLIIRIFTLFLFSVLLVTLTIQNAAADLYVNILAVNGTDTPRDKEIKQYLPKELTKDDILDTAGLDLDYDVNTGSYFIKGKVTLNPKETKTFKVRIKDLWRVEEDQLSSLKTQIDSGLARLEGTEYYDTGKVRHDYLTERLDNVVRQQETFADRIEQRMDRFRVYSKELSDIRSNAISVEYWRAKPPSTDNNALFKFIVDLENTSDEEQVSTPKYFLPSEVKPEHLVETQGFDYRFDPEKGQPYLTKEEKLAAGEKKSYTIEIVDIWNIGQNEIENLKDRARDVFKLLEGTQYEDSASYLISNIKRNLDKVEVTQEIEEPIKDHISTYRANLGRFENAKSDVDALEDLLKAVREDLERSKLRNVLQKVKSLNSIQAIAEAIFGTKPTMNNAWKIITGIVIFVGILTIIYFVVSIGRSKEKPSSEKDANEKKNE